MEALLCFVCPSVAEELLSSLGRAVCPKGCLVTEWALFNTEQASSRAQAVLSPCFPSGCWGAEFKWLVKCLQHSGSRFSALLSSQSFLPLNYNCFEARMLLVLAKRFLGMRSFWLSQTYLGRRQSDSVGAGLNRNWGSWMELRYNRKSGGDKDSLKYFSLWHKYMWKKVKKSVASMCLEVNLTDVSHCISLHGSPHAIAFLVYFDFMLIVHVQNECIYLGEFLSVS